MGTVNIALNKIATASNYIAPYKPSRAVDGNASSQRQGSRWLCRVPGSMTIDLGGYFKVDQWAIQDMSSIGFNNYYKNNKVDLYLSMDGKSWTFVDSMLNGGTTKVIPITNTRFAKVSISTNGGFSFNNKMASVAEFKLFAADPTPNTLLGFAVTGSNGVVQNYTPVFAATTLRYNLAVGADVASVTIKPTATDSRAIVKVNGTVVATGASSAAITLQPGTNTVTMTVEPFVGNINTYTLTIIKKVNNLTGLTVKNGNDAVTITPNFDPSVKEYTGSVDFSDTSFNVQSIFVTPTADSNTKITCNGQTITSGTAITITNPVVGDNVLQITASALDGSNPINYKVTINRKHSTYLKTISCTPGAVTPSVSKTVTTYAAKGGKSAASLSVTLTAEDNTTQIQVTVDGNTTVGSQGTITFTSSITTTPKNANVTVLSADNLSQTAYVLNLSK